MSARLKLEGKRFGKLTVIKCVGVVKRKSRWLCICDCGNEHTTQGASLVKSESTSCGCRVKEQFGNLNRLRPYEALYNHFLNFCKHEVLITYEEFLEFTKIKECHYCGAEITWTKFNMALTGCAYNLDRKDSSKLYYKENCVVCCKRCNMGKSHLFTYDEWKILGNVIRGWQK